MMAARTMRYLCLSLLFLATVTAEDACRLYMAESSTSTVEEPKWGIYAGVDFDERVELGEPDIAIQFHNLMAHAMNEGESEEDEHDSLERKTVELLERFCWVAGSSGGKRELDESKGGHVTTVLPGTALLAAYNGKLTNSAFNHTSSYFRPPVGEEPGVAHPGRGAQSHFFNVAMYSKTLIPAGFELFMDYGENFADDEEAKLYAADFEKVDQLVENMIDFLETHKDELNETSKLEIYNFVMNDVMSAAAGPKKGKLISDMLPDNPDDLAQVKEVGGSFVYQSPQVKRDVEWLEKEGFCMDNLVAGASTILHAGRGAFARRSLQKGETIAPVPLIHLPEKAIVAMHELDEESSYRLSQDVVNQQLFLNYCLGHPESSTLLFPAGGLVPLINHDSKAPNAKLVWSKHSNHHADWFEKDPAELAEEEFAYLGLLMELVATRDIEKGEEVFIDYGKEWEEAWNTHVQEWNNKLASGEIQSEWPTRALDLNQEYKDKAFKTAAELETDPYPEHVQTRCFLYVKVGEGNDDTKPKPWGVPPFQTVYHTDYFYPCNVTDRKALEGEGSYNYTIVVGQTMKVTITDVPQKAVRFVDLPETSDQFTKSAFRHAIGIPDDVFPKGPWRNLEEK